MVTHAGRSVAESSSPHDKGKRGKGWPRSHRRSGRFLAAPRPGPPRPAVGARAPGQGGPCTRAPRLGSQPGVGWEAGGGEGGLFPLRLVNGLIHDLSACCKAALGFIWRATRERLQTQGHDIYCTELSHALIYLSAFCLKQTTEGGKKKKKGQQREKGRAAGIVN